MYHNRYRSTTRTNYHHLPSSTEEHSAKKMNEVMEAELTESSKIDSKTDNLRVTEEADVDEAIPIYIKK